MKRSAGILLFRRVHEDLEVFLVHPGGPFWKNKDAGVWTIPKGEYAEGEDALAAACREFQEETGFTLDGTFEELGRVKQSSAKTVIAWALEQDLDAGQITSNTFQLEWPPRSGKLQEFPEVDRGEWFPVQTAGEKILPGQQEFLDRLMALAKK